MTNFAPAPTHSVGSPSRLLRPAALLGGLLAVVLLACAFAAAPAGAVVTVVGKSTVGLQPRVSTSLFDGTLKLNIESSSVEEVALAQTFANAYTGPVVHGSNIYAIYWDPTKQAYYHGDWQEVIDTFFNAIAAESKTALSNVFAVNSQYTDTSNKPASPQMTFRGAYTDTHAYPTTAGCEDPRPLLEAKAHQIKAITCLTDEQLQQELKSFVAANHLSKGMNTIFYILTPPGVAVCLDAGGVNGHCSDFAESEEEEETGKFVSPSYQKSFCSYHSDLNPDGFPEGDSNTLLYAVVPWIAGGRGDGQFNPADQTSSYDCQNGNWEPVKHEKPAKPYEQEPNQVACTSPDGFCDTGLADLIINQIAIQQQDTTTNPLLNAWQDTSGREATDQCRNFFEPVLGGSYKANTASEAGNLYNQEIDGHQYYLQTAFNMAALRLNYPSVDCIPGISLRPKFTAPTTVNSGDVVGFDGMESDITLNASEGYSAGGKPQPNYATYSWNFGDGTPVVSGYAPGAPACESPWLSPCAASVYHSYQYGGDYEVTLTVTDVGGNTATVSHDVSVVGPPPPPPPPPPAPPTPPAATPGTTAGTPGTTTTPPAPAVPPVPLPVAAAAAVSHSLKSVLHKGLIVRYSVNEQVAGRFEVLLATGTAHRLGIAGTPATGLPAGTPAETVVAKAILVTTKGGRSTVDIQFSPRTAARLKRLRKVSLMLRLVVRNASSHSPATTTVLSPVTLSG